MSPFTRRRAVGAAATALTGLALTGFARAAGGSSPDRRTASDQLSGGHAGHSETHGHGSPQPFRETFQGRLIEGAPTHDDGHHGGYSVRVDGEELHVMRNADSTWVSVINHYETFATPRAVARAAVIGLQGSDLVPLL
ncbi:apotyrosinase chaperone MelC1 [Streptomyces sp. PTY087I2]|uniref:apotyrosinase chaperone MelC1 n=1 Tax=Streptomyces sp. PTY087I2 TaxID=1819298 RepID=UPI00080BF331|nr:tyrosinase cofactor [Streptomyces sp. PTY087I2]OCC08596.1 Tyrosinase co-factor MelC1 [Streptomyces sp. PTY087I2]